MSKLRLSPKEGGGKGPEETGSPTPGYYSPTIARRKRLQIGQKLDQGVGDKLQASASRGPKTGVVVEDGFRFFSGFRIAVHTAQATEF